MCEALVLGRGREMQQDRTIQGETREQEKKDWDWARVENCCKKDKVPAYEASVQYNKFILFKRFEN